MIKNRVINELVFLMKVVLTFGIGILVLFGVSHVLGDLLAEKEVEMVLNQQELPKAMLELIGMQQLQQFPANIEVFFLSILVLNLIVMGMIITHSICAMRQGLERGSFGFLFVQVMKKCTYFIIEIFWTLVIAFLTWGIYVSAIFITAKLLLKNVEAMVATKVYVVIESMSTWGLGVVVLLVAISVLYGVKQSYRMHGMDFGIAIMGVGFIIGNAYKIPQYIGHKQIEQMVNAQETMEVMRMMKEFRFASPFSWLNPFNIYNHVMDVEMIWCYVGMAVLLFVIAGAVFCLRDWWEV